MPFPSRAILPSCLQAPRRSEQPFVSSTGRIYGRGVGRIIPSETTVTFKGATPRTPVSEFDELGRAMS